MFCKQCGKEIPDATKFCGECGAQVVQNQTQPSDSESKKNTAISKIFWAIVALIITVLVVVGLVQYSRNQVKNRAQELIENYSSASSDTQSSSPIVEAKSLEVSRGNEITVSFEYGNRTGLYIGEYDGNGLPHGFGTFSSQKTDGTTWTYSGEWEHGHWNGTGSTVWGDGQTYSGQYQGDFVSGYGMYSLLGGDYLIGECNDSGLNGVGMHVTANGETITGNYVSGVPTGWCAMYLSGQYDGYVFWGYFENGESRGVCYTSAGDCLYAEYSQEQLFVSSELVEDSTEQAAPTAEPLATEPEETVSEETAPDETVQQVTTGMLNATNRARQYLKYSAFSYSGLIGQLEFEGYTNEEATYGADNCGADWYEQAVKRAKQYLDYSSFSKSGLISQLEFEGFTHDQSVYGAEQNGY